MRPVKHEGAIPLVLAALKAADMVSAGHIEVIKSLLTEFTFDPSEFDKLDEQSKRLLQDAVSRGNVESLRLLVADDDHIQNSKADVMTALYETVLDWDKLYEIPNHRSTSSFMTTQSIQQEERESYMKTTKRTILCGPNVKLVHTFDQASSVCSVSISEDGRYIASGSINMAMVFELATGARVATLVHPVTGRRHLLCIYSRSPLFSSLAINAFYPSFTSTFPSARFTSLVTQVPKPESPCHTSPDI